ncbi:MAG: hypothetical protein LC754_11010 [Acidobacteria bacterium]|nr:hypothetical protein [Acidobacteriota bacterium]
MASRLTVIFYIVLCLEAGIVLTIAPWLPGMFGMSDWGDNYLLLLASQKIGLQGLQAAVASGWVRGAVTGLGLLNLAMAFWEMAHFRQTVRNLHGADAASSRAAAVAAAPADDSLSTHAADATHTADPNLLSHHERPDDARNDSVE